MPKHLLEALPGPTISSVRAYADNDEIDFGRFKLDNDDAVRITLLPNGRARVEREHKRTREDFSSLARYLWHRVKSWMGLAGGDAWLLGKRECADAISARWAQIQCARNANCKPVDRSEATLVTPPAQQSLVPRSTAQAGLLTLPTEMLDWIMSFLPLPDRLRFGRFISHGLRHQLACSSNMAAATMYAGVADTALALRRSCTVLQGTAAGQSHPMSTSSQLALLQVLVSRLRYVPTPQYMAAWAVLFRATAAVDPASAAQAQARSDLSEALAQALMHARDGRSNADAASAMVPILSPASMAGAVLALLEVLRASGRLDRINAWLPDVASCFALPQAVPAGRQKEALGAAVRVWLVRGWNVADPTSYSRGWSVALEHLVEHADAFSPMFRALALAELAGLLPGGHVGLLPHCLATIREDPEEAARHWSSLLVAARALPEEATRVVAVALARAIAHFQKDAQRVHAAIGQLEAWKEHAGGEPAWATSVQAMLLTYLPVDDRKPAWRRLWEQAKANGTATGVVDVADALWAVPFCSGWNRVLDYCGDDAAPATPEQRVQLIKSLSLIMPDQRSSPRGFAPARLKAAWYLARKHNVLEPLLELVPGEGPEAQKVWSFLASYPAQRQAEAIAQWLRTGGDWAATLLEQIMSLAVQLATCEVGELCDHSRALLEALVDTCNKMVRRSGDDAPDCFSLVAMKLSLTLERHPGLVSAEVLGALANLVNTLDVRSRDAGNVLPPGYRIRVDVTLKRVWDLIDDQHAAVRRAVLHQLFRRKVQRQPGSMHRSTDDWSNTSLSRAATTAVSLRWHAAGILSYLIVAEQSTRGHMPNKFGKAKRSLAKAVLASSDTDFKAIVPEIFSRWRNPRNEREVGAWLDAINAITHRMQLQTGGRP